MWGKGAGLEVREGRLGGKVAVVTGAASGIGRASAERFAVEGARVMVADLDEDGAEEAAAAIVENGGEAAHVRCDVTRADDVANMVEAAAERYGKLDVLFNNAGFTNPPRPVEETAVEDLDRALAVNVKGVFLCTRAAIPALRDGGGSIIVTASIMGIRTRPGFTAYAASKAAAIHLSRTLALELAGDGIRVNCLAPVATDTPMLATFIGDRDYEEGRKAFISSVPLGRLADPADVASAALYLASDESAFITGAVLPVDGGRGI
jgi:3-oxoacyl-[acyl-carrier protein] reductase